MKTTARKATDHCRIVVINDILGTREETTSPQSAQEAIDNHGLLQPAVDWYMHHCDEDDGPIGLSIQHSDDLVHVRWHPTGDLDVAKAAMRQALGTWEGQR